MASGNDDVSDAESVKSIKSGDTNQIGYNCCVKKECKTLFCVKCDGIFHKSCAIKKNMEIISKSRVICCSNGDGESLKVVQGEAQSGREAMEVEMLRMQVSYLNKLLAESADKNEILKENNRLLLQRVAFFESTQTSSSYSSAAKKRNLSEAAKKNASVNVNKQSSAPVVQMSAAKPAPEDLTKSSDGADDVSQRRDEKDVNKKDLQHNKPVKQNVQQTNIKQRNHEKQIQQQTSDGEVFPPEDAGEENSETNGRSDFEEVRSKKNRRLAKRRFGTAIVSADDDKQGFSGVERKVWINIYRVKEHVTADDVLDYIRKQSGFENERVEVKELLVRSGSVKSFLVKAPLTRKDELYEPSFWPRNVGIRRFKPELHSETKQGSGSFLD